MHRTRTIGREIGTALAVLAIYLLTVLAPLHHARASQLSFATLGYAIDQTGWALCAPVSTGDQDPERAVSKCPAAGIGKQDLLAPGPVALAIRLDVRAIAAPLLRAQLHHAPRPVAPPAGPRAPPRLV